ncbi:MAG: response regulator transcription factor [Planctomycetes bacterium]|nr:response regulator transcription factor [Planctomycetota bacterium]
MTHWCLVVEDEAALGRMICDNLSLAGYGVELARDGIAASERLQKGGLDIVVLDLMLPGKDGFQVLSELRDRGDDTPVLILSARGSDEDRIRGLELRADDYLAKPFNLKELLLRVAAILRRGSTVPAGEDVLEFGGNRVDFRSREATNTAGEHRTLTDSEVKLLRLLSTKPGVVVRRREVVDILFGPMTPSTTRTIDNVVASLRKLFESDRDTPRHFHTVRGVGWRFEA